MSLFGRIISDNERKDKMNPELLPCPICGKEAYFDKTVYKDVGYVYCMDLCVKQGRLMTRERAIKAWNTRSTTKPLDEVKIKGILLEADLEFHKQPMVDDEYSEFLGFLAKSIITAYESGELDKEEK